MAVRTGVFAMDPWQSGAQDGLRPARADLSTDPAGMPWASLQLWLPEGYGHDGDSWQGGRWLRIDAPGNLVEYLVDVDGDLTREAIWSLDGHEAADEELRSPFEDDLRYAFSVMASVAAGLRIAPLNADLKAEYGGVHAFDQAVAEAVWSPGAEPWASSSDLGSRIP